MRVSQGVPCARKVHLYHPELFNEHEEVIVYTREEFKRTYSLIHEQIDYILKVDASLDRDAEFKILGHWPTIMERIHIMGMGVQSFLGDSPLLQTYLDSYLYNEAKIMEKDLAESVITEPVKSLGVSWF